MYVKVYNQILDSSIADNRQLRHFFIDLLLLADPEGNVIMTKSAIANRIRSTVEEVEWGLEELMKPDPESLTQDMKGRRIVPLDGHGYGWQIVNYKAYRDLKTAREMRDATKERVRRFREKQKVKTITDMHRKNPKIPYHANDLTEETQTPKNMAQAHNPEGESAPWPDDAQIPTGLR